MKSRAEQSYWWNLINDKSEDFERVFPQRAAGGIIQPCPLVWYWYYGADFAAYAYELARRADRKLELKEYPELSMDESFFLINIFGNGKARKCDALYVTNLDPSQPIKSRTGYSHPVIFRLDAPMNTLRQVFEKFIKEQREIGNIKPRKSPGETSKRPPWNYVELLDEVDLRGKRPTQGIDPQRTLRTARAGARKHLETFMAGLKREAENKPHSRSYLWPELKF